MASYRIEWRRSTKRDLRRIPEHDLRRVIAAVEQLAEDPHPLGSQKLSGSQFAYRVRVGSYRILYEVWEDHLVIEVIKVGHRKNVYRR